ncbi:MAG: hypothetical protein LBH98_05925 [Chitinispirillales bacterium]|jgi:hypothetical protein|nr:hypothetical protein [Chitinispirillales bacterium]
MIDKLSQKNIWVNPCAVSGGDGSFDFPYSKIQTAINEAAAGSTIVLFPGIYEENLTVRDLCGLPETPITITAFCRNGEKVVSCSEWYFYSVKDFIIKGITFEKTSGSAISMVGEFHRNSIKDCVFNECGETSECAVFFGGSGGDGNVVENCKFNAPKNCESHIAVMVSQSVDLEDDSIACSKNMSVRLCDFENCITAVAAGSGDDISFMSSAHEICDNLFKNCKNAINLKTDATRIFGNIFRSNEIAINHISGLENEIFENRFENCRNAVICKEDATIGGNLFVDSKISAIGKEGGKSLSVLICENTFVSSGKELTKAVICEENLPLFVTKNIFYDCNLGENKNFSVKDNVCNFEGKTEGFSFEKFEFLDRNNGDFSTNLNYGCKNGVEKLTDVVKIPQINILEMLEKRGENFNYDKDNYKNYVGERFAEETLEERDFLAKSMFFEDKIEETEDFEAISAGQQSLRPIGIDGELEDN